MDSRLTSATTHPETAWLVAVVPAALVAAGMLVFLLLLRGRLAAAIAALAAGRAARQRASLPPGLLPDPALAWVPPSLPPGPLLAASAGVCVALAAGASLLAPAFVVLAALGPATVAGVWLLALACERRYARALERELTAAVGRLGALLNSGNGFRQALVKLVAGMDDGPLREEWRFLVERQGVPLAGREGIATPQQVVAALGAQTPSRRHATFLDHLAVAVGQPQDVLAARVAGAYLALQASERRREEAVTELAQMRYSGVAVGLAGLLMALYLVVTQWERVVTAYSSPLGLVAAPAVLLALALPIVGGFALARADDLDY